MKLNQIYNQDCIIGMRSIPNESIDCILTDPPYKYLNNQKLEVDFDEVAFFVQAKRVLKRNGFIVLFGRGTSFYRWNTILADMGFNFKEEIVWDKSYCTSPLMAISRVHETISIYTKGKGVINRIKVPYIEMRSHNIDGIVQDVNRLKTILNNTKSLDSVLEYLTTNVKDASDRQCPNNLTISSNIKKDKMIIRTDRYDCDTVTKHNTGIANSPQTGERAVNIINSISQGMNEKTIIKQPREHYDTIHPTQKPVRLLERLLTLVTKEGDLVLDPFSGSGATALASANTGRQYIGYEIDQEYFEASVNRLQKAIQQTKLAI